MPPVTPWNQYFLCVERRLELECGRELGMLIAPSRIVSWWRRASVIFEIWNLKKIRWKWQLLEVSTMSEKMVFNWDKINSNRCWYGRKDQNKFGSTLKRMVPKLKLKSKEEMDAQWKPRLGKNSLVDGSKCFFHVICACYRRMLIGSCDVVHTHCENWKGETLNTERKQMFVTLERY